MDWCNERLANADDVSLYERPKLVYKKQGKIGHGLLKSFKDDCCCRSAVLKTRSYNQCLLAISVDSLAEVKHGGVVALKLFSISNYKHR